MSNLIADMLQSAPVITDGAWGTQLQSLGLPRGECADAYNLSHPRLVGKVARAYVEAGSQIILTNTFRANRISLAGYGLADKTMVINRAGAQISKLAAGDRARVFASIGPSGKLMMTGEVTEKQLYESFIEQARALAGGGADAIVIETMSDLDEAKLAVSAAKETGLAVVANMVYDSGKKKDRTMMGITPEQAAKGLEEAGADVIGANCGQGIEAFVTICARLRQASKLPLWMKPNAGIPELLEGRVIYKMTAQEFSAHIPRLVESGADFVGGCCGTTPAFIREIAAILQKCSGSQS